MQKGSFRASIQQLFILARSPVTKIIPTQKSYHAPICVASQHKNSTELYSIFIVLFYYQRNLRNRNKILFRQQKYLKQFYNNQTILPIRIFSLFFFFTIVKQAQVMLIRRSLIMQQKDVHVRPTFLGRKIKYSWFCYLVGPIYVNSLISVLLEC